MDQNRSSGARRRRLQALHWTLTALSAVFVFGGVGALIFGGGECGSLPLVLLVIGFAFAIGSGFANGAALAEGGGGQQPS